MSAVEDHTPEAHDVIACELGACILGQRRHRDRVELRVDVAGRIMSLSRNLLAVQEQLGERLVGALAPLAAHLAGPPRRRWWQR
ncbi:hypothetical protein [Nocardioides sp.]|uniref:hypothetical protein n=1 Tax=Nocardioides sp. TaxID=35761 RepID=UPI0035AFB08C